MQGMTPASSQPRLPLEQHALFRTAELDEAREKVARIFCAHRLHMIGRGGFDARHHHVPNDRVSLNYIQYGAKTQISPGALESFYLLQIPLSAGAAIVNGTDRYFSDPGHAAMLNPHLETSMIWEEGCRQLLLRIDRGAMQAHVTRHLGVPCDRPLTFSGPLDLNTQGGARLRRLIWHLLKEAEAGETGNGPLLQRELENAVLTGLLEAHSHSLSDYMKRRVSSVAPRHVRRAEAWMLEHLDQPITIEDVAEAAGVSTRGLQAGFRRFLDTTPMTYLRDARLQRAHEDLQGGCSDTTVTDVAQRWGMTHLGRFSQYYRRRFGCTPQETLRNARNIHFAS